MLTGMCYCKAVQYEVEDDFLYAMNCHCSNCRRTTGSAFKPFAGIERKKLLVTQGAEHLKVYGEADANNTHCALCGSLLFSVVREGEYVHVALGTLLNSPSIKLSEHIFVRSKANWFDITDDLPQFDEFPD